MSEIFVGTRLGHKVDLVDFELNTYYIEDIAENLSKAWRWNGAIDRFYSVAEHCVHVSRKAPRELQLEALMHDSAEAYICDVPRPVKKVVKQYVTLENKLMLSIAAQFHFKHPMNRAIAAIDSRVLITEHEQLHNSGFILDTQNFKGVLPYQDLILPCWEQEQARDEFLKQFEAIK